MTPKKSIYARLADRGLTIGEAAKELGITQKSLSRQATKLGVVFVNSRNICRNLNDRQSKDVRTLMIKGGYSAEEALRIVQRPKKKIRAVPKGAEV